ncbi:MAG: C4-dicarboxylate ABC transporter permease [Rhodobacterales bacterium]|jgi:C4-dicarboxylate transporter DctM subunit|nr:C4-dicarboxylate ABC transporter permease [Rhodobacterales bacterium]|tara:strand:+ start:1748 stop:3046 length:1299 start_codon:yes stop_codon:yes gene_type:complete
MDGFTISLIGFAAILILAFLRFPLALSMGLVGVIGFGELTNYRAAISNLGRLVLDLGQSYSLSVLPLFILMGLLVDKGGMAQQLYRAAYAFLGDKKGGLAMSTVVACGMFSAISGSSIATAATMSKVAMPEMRRYRYADSLATASIAAGGTLGILIPPSVILVIYGLLTEQSIGKLFMAGFIPGFIGILFYTLAVYFVVTRNPSLGPAGERTAWPQRLIALKDVWTTLALFIFVIGGIYIGLFSATEAAGMGAAGALLITFLKGSLKGGVLLEVSREAAGLTAKLFALLFGASMFSNFLNRAGLPDALLGLINSFELSGLAVIFIILIIYILLGCVFESMSMILLTVPIFAPLVHSLGFDLIWFGILVVVVTEISLITPPIGLNVFVLKGVIKDVSVGTIFRGVTPFWVVDIFRLILIASIPSLALFLPSMM